MLGLCVDWGSGLLSGNRGGGGGLCCGRGGGGKVKGNGSLVGCWGGGRDGGDVGVFRWIFGFLRVADCEHCGQGVITGGGDGRSVDGGDCLQLRLGSQFEE